MFSRQMGPWSGQRYWISSPGRLFQHVLHRRAVFAHDVGVIPAGIVQPLLLEIHLVGKDVAVHSAEGAEGVGAEQSLLRGIIGHHDLRPVDQRAP